MALRLILRRCDDSPVANNLARRATSSILLSPLAATVLYLLNCDLISQSTEASKMIIHSANLLPVVLPLAMALGISLTSQTDARAQQPEQAATEETRLSPEAVRAEFAALKKEDVAWRKIDWKICLLDGLKASREQDKPIMLWIFIDRPIDDQRC